MKKIILIIFSIMLWGSSSLAQQTLKINCTAYSATEIFFLQLLDEIADRTGEFKVIRNTPPVGRSLLNVNEGVDDGDGPRIDGLETLFPNLIKVSEPFGVFNFVAFSKNPSIQVEDWESLKSYNVAYIHGWKIFDQHIAGAKSIVKVKNRELLFRLLERDRSDLVLITKQAGIKTIKEMGLQGIVALKPPLAQEKTYLYLNKKHLLLANKISLSLKEIKQDGTYDRLREKIFGSSHQASIP